MKATFVKDAGGNIAIISNETHHCVASLFWMDIPLKDKMLLCSDSVSPEKKREIVRDQILLLENRVEILKSIEF